MVNKVVCKSLLKLSYLFFFIVILSGIFNAVDTKNNLSLLEKDYSLLKKQFEGFLLDFPEINFLLSDYNDSTQYQEIIAKYNSLPRLEVVSVTPVFEKKDVFLEEYTVDLNLSNISKKETLLRVFYKDNYKEYLFVQYILFDKNVYYDFPKEIIKSSDFLESFNGFYKIDKNLSYLTEELSESYQPFKMTKKVVVVEEKKDYTLLYFFGVIFLLLLIYSYKFCKENPTFCKKIKLRIRKLILKIIKKTKQ